MSRTSLNDTVANAGREQSVRGVPHDATRLVVAIFLVVCALVALVPPLIWAIGIAFGQ